MNNRKILVAFSSKTIRKLLTDYLKEGNYSVIEAEDGASALESVMNERPDCVLVHIELPVIQGYALSRIIKNTPELCSTAVILCSTEDSSVYQFWGTSSKSDGFYVPDSENIHILYGLIDKAVAKCRTDMIPLPPENRNKSIYEIITDAYDKELFELYIIKNAYQTGNYVFDIDGILENMAKTLAGIYNYDSLAIIVNAESLVEYYDYSDSISQSDFEDFRKVCRSDYEKRHGDRYKLNWKTSRYTENIIESFAEKTEKLKSYEFFPLEEDKAFPITIHAASCHQNAFNSRTVHRLDFFTKIYSIIIDKASMYQRAVAAERKMKEAFARFIPPAIIDEIIENTSSQNVSVGEKRKVAILIADIRNFTKLSEKNEPEQVVQFLNYYFSKMGAIIKRHGGTIDKFMGDAIMALFGAPESFKYNGKRAAAAALEMMQEIENLDLSLLSIPEDEKFSVGIGIHYGKPIVGAVGSEEKKEYTVIGDDVNLASRVESLTKFYGSRIIITEDVKKDIESSEIDIDSKDTGILPHQIRHLDNVRVKGKSRATHIYELNVGTQKHSEEFLENYEKGLRQYFQKNFNSAEEYFKKAQNINPKDRACFIMIERCMQYIDSIPFDWDGAYNLPSK